jgi:hypothetical protein
VATTVCPVRVLDAEAAAVVEWVQVAGLYEPMTGQIVGLREWPDGGRLADQPATVVEAVHIVMGELQALQRPERKEEDRGTART